MKLKQLQEASYHNQQTWGIHVLIGEEDRTCGPFSSKQEAEHFINRIMTAVEGRNRSKWFEENDFDMYDRPMKIVSPQDIADRLKI